MKIALCLAAGFALAAAVSVPASASPGGLNAQGCHTDSKTGQGYHCHRPQPSTTNQPGSQDTYSRPRSSPSNVYYRNCTAARAAGPTPIRRGEAGYAPHLDRDNDGLACE